MISIVVRPFKSGGVFYPAGTIVDPAGLKLYKSRLGEGKIKVVDEHNLEETSRYLNIRHGVEDAHNTLSTMLADAKKAHADRLAYIEKVKAAAKQYNVQFDGRPIEEVVAEIKALSKPPKEDNKTKLEK